MIQSTQDANGTSFHGDEIYTTLNTLIELIGEPESFGDPHDKVQYEWIMETEDGTVFTIYDWKEYREFGPNERISWHIGGERRLDTIKARKELETLLSRH